MRRPAPRRFAGAVIAVCAAASLAFTPAAPAGAAVCFARPAPGASRAALVVEFADGSLRTRCVSFRGETTGLDLLLLSGLDVRYQDFGGEAAVCRIEGEGCSYPSEPCFCRCPNPGRACSFWGYYIAADGAWRLSALGASSTRVRDGDVHGWRWGEHPAGARGPTAGPGKAICRAASSEAAAGTASGRAGPSADAGGRPGAAALAAFAAGVLALAAAGAAVARMRRRAGGER